MAETLIQSNPWLRDPVERRRAIDRSVASSSAIEGIRAPFDKRRRVKKTAALVRLEKLMRARAARLVAASARSRG